MTKRGACWPLFAFALLVAAGCGSNEPKPHYTYPEAGTTRRDGYQPLWPEIGLQADWRRSGDGGPWADRRTHDGGAIGEGGTATCAGPTAAKCSSACAGDEVCTEAKGGTCAKRLVLVGSVGDKAVLREVALAYVRCWQKNPSDDLLCYAFDTCGMSGVLTENAVTDWVCNKAQISDFPSSADYDTARGLCRCSVWQGQFVYRPDWKIGSIISGKNGVVCLSYDKNPIWQFDRLNVNDCQYFPPL